MTKQTKIEAALTMLNQVGGTSKLDYFRQDCKYHDLWETIANFVKNNNLYPDELSKQMRSVKDSITQRNLDDYLRVNPFNNQDDFYLDLDILTAYSTICGWLKDFNGQERLDGCLTEAYEKIKASVLKLGFADKPKPNVMLTPEEMLGRKTAKPNPEVDAIAEELCERRMQTVEVVPPTVYTTEDILDEIESLSAEKREYYLNKFCALVRFFRKRGEDVGSYELSEDIYLYWRKRGLETKAEIWLKCCCDKWERRRTEICREAAEAQTETTQIGMAHIADTLSVIRGWNESDLGGFATQT